MITFVYNYQNAFGSNIEYKILNTIACPKAFWLMESKGVIVQMPYSAGREGRLTSSVWDILAQIADTSLRGLRRHLI